MASNVGRSDEHNGPLVGGAGIVECHLLVGENLLGIRFIRCGGRIQGIAKEGSRVEIEEDNRLGCTSFTWLEIEFVDLPRLGAGLLLLLAHLAGTEKRGTLAGGTLLAARTR